MEKTGFYNQGGEGIDFIDPVKLVAGQRKNPNVFILAETTAIAIDSIPVNTPAGTIVVNVDGFWGVSGSVQAKEIIDVSGGNLPNTDVLQDDIFLIGVGGTVNGIVLVSGDKVQAKIDNPSQNETGGIFDEWILIEAPKVSSTSIKRPNGDNVETSLVDLETNKVDKVAGKQLSTEDYTTAEKSKLANLGTVANKDVGNQIGEIQENGAILGNSEIVETDAIGKFITVNKNTAYNKNFGTTNGDVARGDASYLKANTYTQTEIDNALTTNSTNDRARSNHTGEQAIATVTGLQTALDSKEAIANKGQANGYASLDGSAKVPASQLPSYVDDVEEYSNLASFPTTGETGKIYIALDTNLTYRWSGSTYVSLNDVDLTNYFNKTTDDLDDINAGATNKHFTATLESKLNGIEQNATADQTDAEIKTAYESNVNTNAFTDAEKTKLAGIEQNATADQTDAEIKTAYENNPDTNAFTDAEKTNLSNQSGTNTGDETTLSIQSKRPLKTVEGQILDGAGNIDLTKADVGLANVDNTSDIDKPISTATQTALDDKLAKASNLSDVTNRQTAINNITDVASANNEDVYTKDTTTGDAIWKPVAGGGGGSSFEIGDYTQSARSSKSGWLLCDGTAVSRSTYADLFAVIGISFGGGDGSTTFTLPDFRGRVFGAIGLGASLINTRSIADAPGQEAVKLTDAESGLRAHTVSGNISGNAMLNSFTTNPNAGSDGAIPYVRDSNGSIYNDGNFDGGRFYRDDGAYHENADMDWIPRTNATLTFSNSVSGLDALSSHDNMQPTLFGGNVFIKY